jgi:hypothetical protein
MMVMAFESRGRRLRLGLASPSKTELAAEVFFGPFATLTTWGLICEAALALFKNVDPTLKAGLGGPATPYLP